MRAIVFKGNDMLVMKRNKFGKQYYTLPGGGMDISENSEQALQREMYEESGLALGDARLVFIEDAGEPYGTQYIYLVNYFSGEPHLNANSIEAQVNEMGKNLYEPVWLPTAELANVAFVSDRLKQKILQCLKDGFPPEAVTIT